MPSRLKLGNNSCLLLLIHFHVRVDESGVFVAHKTIKSKCDAHVPWRGECASSSRIALSLYELVDSVRAVARDDDISEHPAWHRPDTFRGEKRKAKKMQPDLWPLILCHLKLPEQAIARRIDTASRDAILPTDDFILKRRFSDNAEHLQSFFAYMRRHVFVHTANILLEHIPLSLFQIPAAVRFSSVRTLNLRLTRIADKGVESLLRACCNLTAFICVDNPLGLRACKAVARTMMTSTEIV